MPHFGRAPYGTGLYDNEVPEGHIEPTVPPIVTDDLAVIDAHNSTTISSPSENAKTFSLRSKSFSVMFAVLYASYALYEPRPATATAAKATNDFKNFFFISFNCFVFLTTYSFEMGY